MHVYVCSVIWTVFCLVSETLGLSLYNVIKSNDYSGFSLRSSLLIIQQVIAALLFLQVYCRIVHTDLKLENILFVQDDRLVQLLEQRQRRNRFTRFDERLSGAELKIKLIDFGGAYSINPKKKRQGRNKRRSSRSRSSHNQSRSSSKQGRPGEASDETSAYWRRVLSDNLGAGDRISSRLEPAHKVDLEGLEFEQKSSMVNTRQYRAPEVTIEAGWDFKSDVWSVACVLFEIFKGDLLFSTHDEMEHLALIERVTEQRFSSRENKDLLRRCRRYDDFFRRNELEWPQKASSKQSVSYVRVARSMRTTIKDYCRKHELMPAKLEAPLLAGFAALLTGMLKLEPRQRLSARESLLATNKLVALLQ